MAITNEEKVLQELATLKTEVSYLKERDRQLNGTIQRVDSKVDSLNKWLMGIMGGILASIFINLVTAYGGK